MSWFEMNGAEPTVRKPEELWATCPACKAHIDRAEYKAAGGICPHCGAPARIGCRERIALLADEGTFVERHADVTWRDPLSFHDASGAYADKAKATSAKTGLTESVVVGEASIDGIPVILGAMDFRFLGGSLSSGAGERILLAFEDALRLRRPCILACASGGARMHEGILSLMQMAKTSAGIARLDAAGIPYIALLTDPTTGGVSASFAMLGDLNIAEPRALIGFAGRRVIEQTIQQKLPDDFQTAEYLQAHGFIDSIVPRAELKRFLSSVLKYWQPDAADAAANGTGIPAATSGADRLVNDPYDAWQVVQTARKAGRPVLQDYIDGVCDEFIELHGDRLCGDDRGLLGGFATIGGRRVMLLGHRKGRTTEENLEANFGMANPEGYRKALRLMRLAEKYGLPVVCFVDTPGAYPGLEAEARGQAEAIARNLAVMSMLRTPIIVTVLGEGGSGGALGIAVGDRVLMLENAIYSVISPEGCASILWRDGKKAPEAAAALKLTAPDLLKLGVIDRIVPEPEGGAHADKAAAIAAVKSALLEELAAFDGVDPASLVGSRYDKFARMGR